MESVIPALSHLPPRPPRPGAGVVQHMVTNEAELEHAFFVDILDLEPGISYCAEVWVFIPLQSAVLDVSLAMIGYPTESNLPVDVGFREDWQKVAVQCRIPQYGEVAAPSLLVRGKPGAVVFSSSWSFRRVDSKQDPLPPPRQRSYKLISLRELAGASDQHHVAFEKCLPDAEVPIPPVSFGQIDRPGGLIIDGPSDAWTVSSYSIRDADLFKLRGAVVHGEQGIITVDDFIIRESLYHTNPEILGFQKQGDDLYTLSDAEPHFQLDVAAHLMCGHVSNRNYGHWWADVVPALLIPPFGSAFDGAQLLWPKVRTSWQVQTLELLPEAAERSVFVGEFSRVLCKELRFLPTILHSDWSPHPFRRTIIDALKSRAGYKGETGRRIYISRRDSPARKLENEDGVIALLEKFGFEAVTLSPMRLTDQIKLFASASHVIGPHGAGLINVMFCEPNSKLCEFQMRSYVNWSIRRMAAVSRMNYGCILGDALDDDAYIHHRNWTVNLDELESVLKSPAFELEH